MAGQQEPLDETRKMPIFEAVNPPPGTSKYDPSKTRSFSSWE